jgi:hypothetical protein
MYLGKSIDSITGRSSENEENGAARAFVSDARLGIESKA